MTAMQRFEKDFPKPLPPSLFKGRRAFWEFDGRFPSFPFRIRAAVKKFNRGEEKASPSVGSANFAAPRFF